MNKWTTDSNKPPGRNQVNKFNTAWQAMCAEHNNYVELSGVIGKDEHSFSYYSPFGGGNRPEVTTAQESIGEKYGWAISKANAAEVTAAILEALPALRESRPVKDERRTPEQDDEQNAKYAQATQEREQKEADKASQVSAKVAELRGQYPWAQAPRHGLSEHARVAVNMRADLSAAFPGIRFEVKSEYSRITVRWDFGPTGKHVDAITGKYQNSHFDGMTDSTSYDHSIEGEALSVIVGRIGYVSTSRNFSPETFEQVGRMLCEIQHCPFEGMYQRNLCGDGDTFDLRDHVHQVLAVTSFAPGAKIVGAYRPGDARSEWHAAMFAKYGTGWASSDKRSAMEADDRAKLEAYEAADNAPDAYNHWSALRLEAPERVNFAPAESVKVGGATMTENHEKGGIEIRFPGKPAGNVLDQLKAHGWRWSRFGGCWYKCADDATRAWAKTFLGEGGTAEQPQAGSDRFDMDVEDNMAAACGPGL